MFDHSWILYLNGILFQNKILDGVIYFIAEPFPFLLLAFTCIYFGFIKKGVNSGFLMAVVVGAWIFAEIFKFLFKVPRPFLAISEVSPLFVFGGYDSLPSGHAVVFSVLATAIFLEDRKSAPYFIIAAVLIGLSRVIAGVHYPIDILIGFIMGCFGVILTYKIIGKLRNNNRKSED